MLGKWLFYSEEGHYLAQFTFHLQSLQRAALNRSGAVALLEILRFSSLLAASSTFLVCLQGFWTNLPSFPPKHHLIFKQSSRVAQFTSFCHWKVEAKTNPDRFRRCVKVSFCSQVKDGEALAVKRGNKKLAVTLVR